MGNSFNLNFCCGASSTSRDIQRKRDYFLVMFYCCVKGKVGNHRDWFEIVFYRVL